MNTLLFLCAVVCVVLLLLVASVTPHRSQLSSFERKRRVRHGDKASQLEQQRETAYTDITSLQRVVTALLLVVATICLVFSMHVFIGILSALVLAFEYNALARMSQIHAIAMRLYARYETTIIQFAESYKHYLWWVRSMIVSGEDMRAQSRDELEHIVLTSEGVLSQEQKLLITSALSFNETKVEDIMTKKTHVRFIKKSEILGPLVLDDLYSSGHTSFPVTKTDAFEQVLGILHLADVQTIDTKRKHTALVETAMRPHVHTITTDDSLDVALKNLLRSEQHMLVVINDDRKPIGIITMADVLKRLFGASMKV